MPGRPIGKLRTSIATTALLTRHIVRTMLRQRLRTGMVWLALAAALAVIIGAFSFITSIDDSFNDRGRAVRGVSDVRVQAVGRSTFAGGLAGRLEQVKGTRYVVPIDEERIAIGAPGGRSVIVSAFGIDRHARKLRSVLQRDLNVKTPRNPAKGGLTVSTTIADRLGVKRGDKVRILVYHRSPKIKIQRVVRVGTALSEVVALPRKSIENLRGTAGRPNRLYVALKPGTSEAQWRTRAASRLPDNAAIVTPASQQAELDAILDFTTRSYTYLFGAVALLIAALLVYVLQLMRMIDRQEDAGLVRALGSSWVPLAAAEIAALAGLTLAALPAGVLLGHWFGARLSSNLPDYLTQIFNFTMHMQVKPTIVVGAGLATLVVGALATVAALVTTRRPIADQLGRAPQSGGTNTSPMSVRAAITFTAAGGVALLLATWLTHTGHFSTTAVTLLVGLGLITPGIAGLLIAVLLRGDRPAGKARLVARAAIGAHPRRVGMSAAIVALAIAAVIPLQLSDRALGQRADELTAVQNPTIGRIAGADDVFATVPVSIDYARRALKGYHPPRVKIPPPVPGQPAPSAAQLRKRAQYLGVHKPLPSWAAPFVSDNVSYRQRRIAILALDANKDWLYRGKAGLANGLPKIRRHPNQIGISTALAGWTGLHAGDKITLPTAHGPKSVRIATVVNDMSWPTGTAYIDISLYRKLNGWTAINSLIVKPGKIDHKQLDRMRPMITYSGADVAANIRHQMDMTRDNMLAMRLLIVLAAMIAVSGILATSVFARRREWGVLRAVGIDGGGLLLALAVEVALILLLGAAIGVIGGIVTYEGPILAFMSDLGFPLSRSVVVLPLVTTALAAMLVGGIAVTASAIAVVRARVTDALAYE